MVQYWTAPGDLPGLVALSLMQLRKSHPAEGWVRGNNAMTPEVVLEIAELKARVAELTAELSTEQTAHGYTPSEPLADGETEFTMDVDVTWWSDESESNWEHRSNTTRTQYKATWDDIFGYLAPSMMNEASDDVLYERLSSLCYDLCLTDEESLDPDERWAYVGRAKVEMDDFNAVKVQLSALGLIEVSDKKRGVADKATNWKLTGEGSRQMMRLRTLSKGVDLVVSAGSADELA